MQPRIVFRTHYQVDEPAYMEFLIKLCTSPVQSTYPEVVAQKLAGEITTRGGRLNVAAGRYAVDLARDLRLITPNNTWTDTGHLVNLIAGINDDPLEEQLKLTLPERLLHFRVFLAEDGAALLFLARRLVQYGSVANSDATWNSWAKDMFVEVYSKYLAITNNTADRVKLRREVDRIKVQGYEGNSGSHKIFIHMQTLYRLGLVTRPDSAGSRAYQLPDRQQGTRSDLGILLDEVPDVDSLEKVVNTHKWIEVAARVFQITHVHPFENTVKLSAEKVLLLMIPYYRRIMSTGTPLCPLSTLVEAIQIDLLTGKSKLLTYDEAMNLIVAAQKERPKDIRFHVDRRGKPAFVKLSDDVVEIYSAKKVPA